MGSLIKFERYCSSYEFGYVCDVLILLSMSIYFEAVLLASNKAEFPYITFYIESSESNAGIIVLSTWEAFVEEAVQIW